MAGNPVVTVIKSASVADAGNAPATANMRDVSMGFFMMKSLQALAG